MEEHGLIPLLVTDPADEDIVWEAFDDVRGGTLAPEKVRGARQEEIAFVKNLNVYKYVTIEEARAVSGKNPIGVKWVDTDKGDRYRSRLCAMEFKRKAVASIFSGTPPHESLRIMAALLAGIRRRSSGIVGQG